MHEMLWEAVMDALANVANSCSQSRAVLPCFDSGTRESDGFRSVSSKEIESNTLERAPHQNIEIHGAGRIQNRGRYLS